MDPEVPCLSVLPSLLALLRGASLLSDSHWLHIWFSELFCAEGPAYVKFMWGLLLISLREEVVPTAALSPIDVVSASVIAPYCWQC